MFGLSGGGCAAGGDAPGAPAALALLALMWLVRRRRRFRLLALAALAAATFPAAARAQTVDGDVDYNVERFQLSSDRGGILDVESAAVPAHKMLDVGLWLGYANDALVVYREVDGERERVGSLVHDRLGGALVGAIGLFDRFALSATLPVVLYQGDDPGDVMPGASLSTAAVGDLVLAPRAQLTFQERHGVDTGVQVGVSLPTATSDAYVGDGGVTVSPALLVGRRFGGVRTGLNLGYLARSEKSSLDLDVDDEVYAKVGAGVPVDPVEVDLSLRLATASSDLLGSFNRNHIEALAGVSVPLPMNLVGFAAGGIGLAEAYGTPDFRVLIGARLGYDLAGAEPPIEVTVSRGEPTPEPAPAAGDRDGDGLLDDVDGCPDDAEDMDSFEDTDGCPDPDNDKDTVLDTADACVNEPGVVANQGCPDPDRDGDTVVDRLDNCPDEPGDPARQGCKAKQLVTITGDRIDILEKVHFKTNSAVILRQSNALLDNVASVLSSHPSITKVEVQGHTDDRGNDAYNLGLSQRRAEAVVAYLVDKGIAAERLTAVGHGETRPIQEGTTNAARTANRRVEFVILGGGGKVKVVSSGTAPDEARDR
ncbi:MAG TPA: OmpA family protein [Kofleriaceae bacterium]|nr:OmpA family protein [Kofleriaceae bacterium]